MSPDETDQSLENREPLVYGIIISLCFSLLASMWLQLFLRLATGQLLALLAPFSTHAAVGLTMLLGSITVIVFVVMLRWFLPLALGGSLLSDGARNFVPFSLLNRAFGLVGFLMFFTSLATLGGVQLSYWAKFTSYLQLVPTAAFSAAALFYPRYADDAQWRWLRHRDLEGTEGRLVWLITDLLCFGLLVGLLTYQACISNLLHITGLARPEMAESLYIHGLRAGMLLAIWFTPGTEGNRPVMSVAFLVDWLAEKVINPNFVPLLQFVLVWVALAPFHSREEGLKRTIRLGLGLCAGRVVGRALGALFLGEEGPILLEPISELVLALWLFPQGFTHGVKEGEAVGPTAT